MARRLPPHRACSPLGGIESWHHGGLIAATVPLSNCARCVSSRRRRVDEVGTEHRDESPRVRGNRGIFLARLFALLREWSGLHGRCSRHLQHQRSLWRCASSPPHLSCLFVCGIPFLQAPTLATCTRFMGASRRIGNCRTVALFVYDQAGMWKKRVEGLTAHATRKAGWLWAAQLFLVVGIPMTIVTLLALAKWEQ
jgi:hypothetical protein